MDTQTYLYNLLVSQTLQDDGEEMKQLCAHRQEVEELIGEKLKDCSPAIRYGGSKAKGTMVKESYDLDILCYFDRDDTAAGCTLEEIYNNMEKVLEGKYRVERKKTALRLKDPDPSQTNGDYHIDLVPGRYSDDSQDDVYLHQESGDKDWLKTNPDIHIEHVQKSGVRDAIRILKLWNVRNRADIKTFVLELLVIDLLKNKKGEDLSDQIVHVLTEFRDHAQSLMVEDPANPSGNDLGDLWNDAVKNRVSSIARDTLWNIENQGWETTFGPIPEESKGIQADLLKAAAASVARPTKPWS